MEELQQDDDALLAAAIELSLVPQQPPPQQPQPSLPQPLDAFSSVLSEASNRDASVGLNSLLVSLQQALGQPAPADEGAKMVLCVRRDLGMSTGKIAAQCGHATLGLYKTMVEGHPRLLGEWEDSHCPKIALRLDDEQQMMELEQRAAGLGLPTHIVMDAGKTQIARGSRTVLAIAGKKAAVDSVTGHLKLL